MHSIHLLTNGDSLGDGEAKRSSGVRVRLGVITAAIALLALISGIAFIAHRRPAIRPDAVVAASTPSSEFSITVRHTGGFRPWGDDLRQPSRLHVFNSVLYTGQPVSEVFPGPLLLRVEERKLTDDQVAALKENAEASGLLRNDVNYGVLPVTDIPETWITVRDGTSTYVTRVFALGMEGDMVPGRESGVTGEQLANRKKILNFIDHPFGQQSADVDRLVATPVTPTKLVIAAQEVDQLPATTSDGPNVRQVPFPVPGLLATIGFCKELADEDVTRLLPALANADSLTYFTDGTRTFQVATRPLLPGEVGCPS